MSCMGLVTDVDDENAPIVLLVDNNPMSRRRIEQSLRTKEFVFINCEDGDNAVDVYSENMPDLVIMALDIPSMDGHVAALEIREADPEARIIFLAPSRRYLSNSLGIDFFAFSIHSAVACEHWAASFPLDNLRSALETKTIVNSLSRVKTFHRN